MSEQNYEQLTLFPAGSPASRSVLPGSAEARKMTVTSGLKCLELSRNSGPLGSLVKMLLGSSTWRSTRCYLTWKVAVTPAKRLLFRLVPQTPRTDETDAQLLPTVTATVATHGGPNQRDSSGRPGLQMAVMSWPTPTAADVYTDRLKSSQQKGDGRHSLTLGKAVQMWPTPTAREYKGGRKPETLAANGRRPTNSLGDAVKMWPTPKAQNARGCGEIHGDGGPSLDVAVGGQLNPDWVEWLMGFPVGWTSL